jgi:hypothetical protein
MNTASVSSKRREYTADILRAIRRAPRENTIELLGEWSYSSTIYPKRTEKEMITNYLL